MGIRVSRKTDKPATLKLLNHLCSFSFEHQYGEMEKWDSQTKDCLKKLIDKLGKMV